MTSWTSQSQLTSNQSLNSTSAGGWGEGGEVGGGVVGDEDAVLPAVGVGVGLFVGGHDDLASLAGALVSTLDSALDLATSLSGALSLSLGSAFVGSFTGVLSFTGSFAGALSSVFADSLAGVLSLDSALDSVVADEVDGDSSAPAGIAPSRSTRSATIIAVTPLLVISSLLRDKSSC